MSVENLNETTEVATGVDTGELADALTDGDGEFVGEESETKGNNIFLVIGLVLAVIGGGYLWYSRSGPATALAGTDAPDATKQTVSKFLDGGTANIALMQKMLRETEKVVQQFLSYPSVQQIPLEGLQTNPFRFRKTKVQTSAGDSETAVKKRREEERAEVLQAVSELQLQFVLHSGTRKNCMINNSVYLEGQQVDSFVIEKINAGSVIVKSGVYRFELKMQK